MVPLRFSRQSVWLMLLFTSLQSVFKVLRDPSGNSGEIFWSGIDHLLNGYGGQLHALDLRQTVLETLLWRLPLDVISNPEAREGQPFLELAAHIAVFLDLGTPLGGISLLGIASDMPDAYLKKIAAKRCEQRKQILFAIAEVLGLSDVTLRDLGDAGCECRSSIFTRAFASKLRKRYYVLRSQRVLAAGQQNNLEPTIVDFYTLNSAPTIVGFFTPNLAYPPVKTFAALMQHRMELHAVDLRELILQCVFTCDCRFRGKRIAAAARLVELGAPLTRTVENVCTSPICGPQRLEVLVGSAYLAERENELISQLGRWKKIVCEQTQQHISAAESQFEFLVFEAGAHLLRYTVHSFVDGNGPWDFKNYRLYPGTCLDDCARASIKRLVEREYLLPATISFIIFLQRIASDGGPAQRVYKRILDGFRVVFRAACQAGRDAELIALINASTSPCENRYQGEFCFAGTLSDHLATFKNYRSFRRELSLEVLNALRRSGLLGPFVNEVKATVERSSDTRHRELCVDLLCKWQLQDRRYATYVASVLRRITGVVVGHLIVTFAIAEPLPFVMNAGLGCGAAILCARCGLFRADQVYCCCVD